MRLIIFTLLTLGIYACSNETNEQKNSKFSNDSTDFNTKEIVSSKKEINSDKNVINKRKRDYQEFYPNGAVKIEGNLNDNKERNGLWISYYENGVKWSESYYINGAKNGHSITFYPNGKVRYMGEYKDNNQIGTWYFYNENGAKIDSVKY